MSNASELPQMVTELVDLSRTYLQEETVEPMKRLGRSAGLGLGAAVLFAIGALLLTIAILRWIVGALPDTTMWSALGYGIGFAAAAAAIGLLAWRASR